MQRNLGTVLARMIAPDWEKALWWMERRHAGVFIAVAVPQFCWTGELSDAEWHRLMQHAINAMGRAPDVRDFADKKMAAPL